MMNLSPLSYHLKKFALSEELNDIGSEQAWDLISRILSSSDSNKESWLALLELFSAWPDIGDITKWVNQLLPKIDHWDWRIRESYLGQSHTRAEKSIVYQLVGYLYIHRLEDTFGNKLKRLSNDANLRNIYGLCFSKIECPFEAIGHIIASDNFKKLREIKFSKIDSIDAQIGQIFSQARLNDLEKVSFMSCNISQHGLGFLADSQVSKTLNHIVTSASYTSLDSYKPHLQDGHFPQLQTIDVSHSDTTQKNLESFISELQHRNLKRIIIRGTPAASHMGAEHIDL